MAQPAEIVTPGAHTNGVLTRVLTDLYNQAVWQRLVSLTNAQDIVDIMRIIASRGQGVKITKWVNPPVGSGNQGAPYAETFFDCVVSEVRDNEAINIASMEVNKEMDVWYTYSRKICGLTVVLAHSRWFTHKNQITFYKLGEHYG